ncbi:hypothetical protein [Weissella paramesenteroides]|uniref:hypothetical protein n=1 Tax=Weissella paramesenteroides TaxID=1249 RepID=UPI00140AA891|nr:hypothetical protein [Weissella paramesenteroides]WPQ68563.1 hypothetical protein QRX23_02945 [Weissella paramesenteroides]
MTEHKFVSHPALQTDNYVRATTLVPDKYGIIQLSSDLSNCYARSGYEQLKR